MKYKKIINFISTLLSTIFEPKITYLLFLLYVSLFVFENLYLFLFTLLFCLLSLIVINYKSSKLDHLDDYRFSDNRIRIIRYIIYSLTFIISIAFLSASILNNNNFHIFYFAIVILVTLILLFISRAFKFKTSAHISYTGLLILYFFNQYNYKYLILIFFTLFLGFARIYLRKHSKLQILIAFIIVLIAFIISDLILPGINE